MLKYLTLYFPPLALAPIRLSLATALLFPVVLYKEGLIIPPIATFLPIAGVATFSIYLHQITLSWGISQTSSMHASLILGLNPLLTTVLATYLMKEHFSLGKALGILLGFSGVALVVSGGTTGASTLIGDLVMFAATITFVIGSLFVKKSTRNLSPLIVTAYSHGLASIGLLLPAVCSIRAGPIRVRLNHCRSSFFCFPVSLIRRWVHYGGIPAFNRWAPLPLPCS